MILFLFIMSFFYLFTMIMEHSGNKKAVLALALLNKTDICVKYMDYNGHDGYTIGRYSFFCKVKDSKIVSVCVFDDESYSGLGNFVPWMTIGNRILQYKLKKKLNRIKKDLLLQQELDTTLT